MKWKKVIALGLACLLAVSGLTGCGKEAGDDGGGKETAAAETDSKQENAQTKEEEKAGENGAAGTAAEDPFGKYEEGLDVHFVRATDDTIETYALANLPGETLEDNFWLDTYREELGINVVYDWVVKGAEEYSQKVNVTIATGEIPDIMAVSSTQMMQLADAGLIQDLSEVYQTYAADFTKECLNQEGEAPFLAGQKDGKMYGIPVTGGSVDSIDLMWIRDDWLKKLGLEAPKTMEELLNVIEQFTNGDPDGDGQNNTYGIGVAGSPNVFGGGYGGLKGFFNAYEAYPTIWIEKDGALVYGAIQEECKTALLSLQTLYKEGKINPEFGVMDSGKAGEAGAAGKCGLTFGQQWLSLVQFQSNFNLDNNAKWSAYPIPSATDQPSVAQADLGTNSWLVVRKDFENPEALIKMTNLFIEKCWGETGDNSVYYAPPVAEGVWKLSPVQSSMPLKNIQAYEQIQEAMASEKTAELKGEAKSIWDKLERYYSGSEDGKTVWGWERIYGPAPSSYSSIKELQDGGRIMINQFVGAPTETMTEKMSTLEKMRDEIFTKIIIGEASVDEFDKFVADFNNLGGKAITEEVNAWYSSIQ